VRKPGRRKKKSALAARALDRAFQQAVSLHQRGDLDQAESAYRQILTAVPRHCDALHLLGVIAAQRGRAETAVELIGRAISIDGTNAAAYANRGKALQNLQRWEESLTDLSRAVELNPLYPDAFNDRGIALQYLGRLPEASTSFSRAIELNPGDASAYNNLAVILQMLGRPEQALTNATRALELRPGFAQAHYNRGNALRDLQRWDEAIASYAQAIGILPSYADAHNNLGLALRRLGRLDQGAACFARAIQLQPRVAETHVNQAVTLQDLQRWDEALAAFRRATELDPGFAVAHWNEAVCRLLMGDLTGGWPKYEYRWLCTEHIQRSPEILARPQWNGETSLRGRTILLYAEQGLGDTLQFCRYVKLIATGDVRVILLVQPPLVSLLRTLEGVTEVIGWGDELPPFDYQCPLLSLPLAFKTDLATIPAHVPYLHIDAGHAMRFAGLLGPRTRPRIGLAWSGKSAHPNDHNRSIPLADLAQLLSCQAQWVSLQKDVRPADQPTLVASELLDVSSELEDFSDTAALLSQLDLIVTVDTSVAHLAGALGKPTWVLLPFAPDWRWLTGRTDSPWYVTMRLFRQPVPGDWASVIRDVKTALS
jgi:tetratricopeptide (TPR) repeat protein